MTTLTLNEIRIRAATFAKDFADAHRENAESQIFWHEFFQVFGLPKRRVISFEHNVKKLGCKDGRNGRIDAFWPGTLLVEQKSRGKDLDAAFTQGNDYFHGLSHDELPRYVIVSDFARIRLVDVEGVQPVLEFDLKDLPRHSMTCSRPMVLLATGLKCCWCGCCFACLQTTQVSSRPKARLKIW